MTIVATDPVAIAKALIRCQSVTPHEAGALTLIENIVTPLGFACHRMTFSDVDTPDVVNLYARRGVKGPNLCFAGHTDVVPPGLETAWTAPPFEPTVRDGILYGRGAVDMKGAVACFIAAAAREINGDPDTLMGSLSLLITGDEEGPSINGTSKLLDWLKARDERLDACVVGEPSNPVALGDEIKIGRRGSLNGEIVVRGRQGHAAYPRRADNPVPKLVRLLDRLSRLDMDKGTANFEPSNLEITVFSSPNTATNVIPAEARAAFNIRYNDLWRRPDVEAWVRLQLEAAAAGWRDDTTAKGNREIEYDVGFSGTGDVFLTEPGPLVDTMIAAVTAETGRKPALTTGGGTSDARFIKDACPVIEFGLVNASIHQIDEHVPLADLETLTRIYQRFIRGFFAVV